MSVLRAAIGVLAAAGVVVVVIVLFFSGASGYEAKLNFADANGLLKGSRVEVDGVGVGSVKTLKITPQDHALVTVQIDKAQAPLGTNATAVIRSSDLLGEQYIDLTPGNRARPGRSGFTIPVGQTEAAPDFDQVTDILGPTERDRLAILIHETGIALFGRGADVAELLRALPPSLGDAQHLMSQLTASNDQLIGLLTHASGVMASLDTNQRALQHFVATAAGALRAPAEHTADLQQSVAEAPGLLTALDTTLGRLDVAGAHLHPAARGLESTAPALTETLKELPGFTTAALPTLTEIRSISPQLVSLGNRASPVVSRLEPTLNDLDTLATAGTPVSASLNSGIDNLLGFLQGWSRALQVSDGLGHEFRVSTQFSPAFASQILSSLAGTLVGSAQKKQSARSSAPADHASASASSQPVTPTASSLGNGVAKTTQTLGGGVSGAVNKVASGVGGTVANVTGQLGATTAASASGNSSSTSSSSLSNLLGYLMGGK